MRQISFLVAVLAFSMEIQAQSVQSWQDSLAVLGKQILQSPQSVDLRLKKAAVNLELNQWDYAIDEYGRVLDIEPRNLSALYFRAYAHHQQRHYELAKADYESILALVPKHFESQLGLAMVKRNMGRVVEAMDELNRLVQAFPDSALAYAARAGYEAEQKQYEPALYDWDEAIRLKPDNVDFAVSKVEVLLALHRKREAKAHLQQLVKAGVPKAELRHWMRQCQ